MTRLLHLGLIFLMCMTCSTPQKKPPEVSTPLRVLIIGDSISIGYTQLVRARLGDSAVVLRPMRSDGIKAENCEGTTKGVAEIDRWLTINGGKFDIIHFNFGLHDLKRISPVTGQSSDNPEHPPQVNLDKYIEQLELIIARLQTTDSRLIFATTTPVPIGKMRPHREPDDVVRYNVAAVKLMKAQGIEVNDLYSFSLPRLTDLQRPSNVHFTRVGSKVLAAEVVKAIQKNKP